jgi:hypothetical protein
MHLLTIHINDQLAFEYDKSTVLNDEQLTFLDKMDQDMSRGLKVHGELISKPDTKQCATFVAMNLIRALLQEDEAKVRVSCAYLSTRLPDLSEVHARDDDGKVKIEFIEETKE